MRIIRLTASNVKPERPASTCTRKPGHDPAIGHQVYCRDRLYVWHATPPPLFLPSPSPNRDGAHETAFARIVEDVQGRVPVHVNLGRTNDGR